MPSSSYRRATPRLSSPHALAAQRLRSSPRRPQGGSREPRTSARRLAVALLLGCEVFSETFEFDENNFPDAVYGEDVQSVQVLLEVRKLPTEEQQRLADEVWTLRHPLLKRELVNPAGE